MAIILLALIGALLTGCIALIDDLLGSVRYLLVCR